MRQKEESLIFFYSLWYFICSFKKKKKIIPGKHFSLHKWRYAYFNIFIIMAFFMRLFASIVMFMLTLVMLIFSQNVANFSYNLPHFHNSKLVNCPHRYTLTLDQLTPALVDRCFTCGISMISFRCAHTGNLRNQTLVALFQVYRKIPDFGILRL